MRPPIEAATVLTNDLRSRSTDRSKRNRDRWCRAWRLASRFVLAFVFCFSGCRPATDPDGSETDRRTDELRAATVQLNWYPEAEHGGVFQAVADGTYRDAGWDVTIAPGGINTPLGAELLMGRAQFAITNADDVVLLRRGGADVVAVAAVVQNSPRCILVRSDSGVESLDDLEGITLQRQAGRLFLEYMRSRRLLDGVREVPYGGTPAVMTTDPKIAIQAYVFSEPYLASQAGLKTRELMVSQTGWNPYSSVLVTTGEMIREQPAQVQSFVDATLAGWRNYLTDPAAANAAILRANRHGMTAEALEFGMTPLRELTMPDAMAMDDVGKMTAERWQTLCEQIDELSDSGTPIDPRTCYDMRFISAP